MIFKKLGIKTVPVTLRGSPVAKAAIRIILGELTLHLLRMGRQRLISGTSPSYASKMSTSVQGCSGYFGRPACSMSTVQGVQRLHRQAKGLLHNAA